MRGEERPGERPGQTEGCDHCEAGGEDGSGEVGEVLGVAEAENVGGVEDGEGVDVSGNEAIRPDVERATWLDCAFFSRMTAETKIRHQANKQHQRKRIAAQSFFLHSHHRRRSSRPNSQNKKE